MLELTLARASTALGILSLIVAVFAVFDSRRQRNEREKAVNAAHALIERAYGTLIGIKAAVAQIQPPPPDIEALKAAIGDALLAINQERPELARL